MKAVTFYHVVSIHVTDLDQLTDARNGQPWVLLSEDDVALSVRESSFFVLVLCLFSGHLPTRRPFYIM